MPSRVVQALLLIVSVSYPFLLYFGSSHVPAVAFAALACVLLALRACLGAGWMGPVRIPILSAILVIATLAALDDDLAAKAYPVAISWGFALLFAQSLWRPVSLVERFAMLQGDVPNAAARRYCRRVTLIWAVWLSLNGGIAAALAALGRLEAWTLWTGLLSYLVSGAIFAAEFAWRQVLRRRQPVK